MKKHLVLGTLIALAIIPSSCVNRTDTSGQAHLTFSRDSVATSSRSGRLSIAYDLPVKHDLQLYGAVAEFFSESMGGGYEGDITESDSLAAFYQRKNFDSMSSFFEEYLSSSGIDAESMCFDEISFDKIAEGDRYLTYLFTQTSYMGGAHGSTIYKGATFRKSDGRRIGWDVVAPDPYAESLQKSIDRGLREYWKLSASDNLKEYLFDENAWTLPLPKCDPLFGPDGITFIYNEYEIAAYASGRPTFTVPYSELEGQMMVTAKRLTE